MSFFNEDHTHRIEGTTYGWFIGTTQVFLLDTDHTYRDVIYDMFPKYPQNMFSRCGDNSPRPTFCIPYS